MLIDKNIIFIYPLNAALADLKAELEAKEGFEIFEIDMLAEYSQIIGTLEHSCTFSGDVKKTASYLDQNKKFLKGKSNTKNYLVTDNKLNLKAMAKLTTLGLSELIEQSKTNTKSLLYKIDMFYAPFEKEAEKILLEEKKKQEAKQKRIEREMRRYEDISSQSVGAGKELRVEKLSIEENSQNQQGNIKVKQYNNLFETPELERRKIFKARFQNPFDQLKRANPSKTHQFIQEFGQSNRTDMFRPMTGVLNKKSTTSIEDRSGDLNRKNVNQFEEVGIDKKKRKTFEDTSQVVGAARGQFDEVAREGLKGAKFDAVDGQLNRKRLNLEEVDPDQKRKGRFEPLSGSIGKKNADFDEKDKQLDRKSGILSSFEDSSDDEDPSDEVEDESLARKKLKTTDLSLDPTKKKGLDLEEGELESQRKKLDITQEEISRNKNKNIEHIELDLNKKNAHMSEIDREDNLAKEQKKKTEIERKTLGKFEEVELEKESKAKLDLIEKDKDRKSITEQEISEDNLKGKQNADDQSLSKKKAHLTFSSVEKDKKKSHFREDVIAKFWGSHSTIQLDKEKRVIERELAIDPEKIDRGEQTIDYAKLKKQYKEGNLSGDDAFSGRAARKSLRELLEEPEVTFYTPYYHRIPSLLEFYNNILINEYEAVDHFSLFNQLLLDEFNGCFALFLITTDNYIDVYSGYDEGIFQDDPSLWNKLKSENLSNWSQIKLPTWLDETFQAKENRFIYPLFEDHEQFGFITCDFVGSIRSHQDSIGVESFIMCLKSLALSLHPYKENS